MPSLTARMRSIWPFGPIFSLELRQLARRPQTYALRFIYLGLFLAFLSFASFAMNTDHGVAGGVVEQAQHRAMTGRVFFQIFGMFSVIAMHLVGPILTSTSIGVERTRRTLDVLLMTPISAWQIVAGKLMSRLWTAIMLVALSLPLLAIVRLLGGVELKEALGVIGMCAATALGSAAIGLLYSAMIDRVWAVVLLAYFTEFSLYFVLPIIGGVIYQNIGGFSSPGRATTDLFAAFNPIYTTGFILIGRGAMLVSWWPAILVQIVLACVLTFFTAIIIRRSANKTAPESQPGGQGHATLLQNDPRAVTLNQPASEPVALLNAPGLTPPPLPGVPVALPYQAPENRRARDVSDRPILWHELRRPLMRRTWQRLLGVTITIFMLGLSYFAFGLGKALSEPSLQIAYAFVLQTMLLLIAIVVSASSIANEKESDTWTLLIAAPLTPSAIIYGKFLGILRRLMWPWLLIVAHFSIFTLTGVISPVSWFIVLWTTLTFPLVWIATGLYLSIRCQRSTTAIVFNLLLPLIAFLGVPMILSSLQAQIEPHIYNRWSEATCYYLPYYFTGNGIFKPGGADYSYLSTFELPMSSTQVSMSYFPLLAIASGMVQIILAQLMLMATCRHFDRMVGRSRSRKLKGADYSRSSVPAVTPS